MVSNDPEIRLKLPLTLGTYKLKKKLIIGNPATAKINTNTLYNDLANSNPFSSKMLNTALRLFKITYTYKEATER